MTHDQSLFYLRLFSNALMGLALGIVFPYTLLSTARTLRYMQNPSAKTWVRMAIWWVGIMAMSYTFGIINAELGAWNSEVIHVYLQVTAAIFTLTFGIYCWLNRSALRSLYPEADFIIEQQKHRMLLDRLQVCDRAMPTPRMESKHGIVIYANHAALKLLEYSLQELHAHGSINLVHPDDREMVLRTLLARNTDTYECRIITASKRVVHVEVHSTQDPNDADIRITFLVDVTNYVEQRDRFMRELRLQRATDLRRVAEDNLYDELSQPHLSSILN